MDRLGIDYLTLGKSTEKVEVFNRFGGGSCQTTPLVARCISKIYALNDAYDSGKNINVADFDRLRYFVLEADKEAYYTCID